MESGRSDWDVISYVAMPLVVLDGTGDGTRRGSLCALLLWVPTGRHRLLA